MRSKLAVVVIGIVPMTAQAQEPLQTPEPTPGQLYRIFAPIVAGWTRTEIRAKHVVFWLRDGSESGTEVWQDPITGEYYPNRIRVDRVIASDLEREITVYPYRPVDTPPGEPEVGNIIQIPKHIRVSLVYEECMWYPYLLPPGAGRWECNWKYFTVLPWG